MAYRGIPNAMMMANVALSNQHSEKKELEKKIEKKDKKIKELKAEIAGLNKKIDDLIYNVNDVTDRLADEVLKRLVEDE